jgi:uncharacterized membrane protein YphA (DoxX/SURF4 family)
MPGIQKLSRWRWALLAGRIILAGIFIAAGYLKLREPWLQFAVSINSLKIVPDNYLEPLARSIPWLELVLGLVILSGVWLRWSAAVASLVLAGFLTILTRSYALGMQVDCGCFGSGEPLGPKTLARDSLMLALALAVTIGAFLLRKRGTGPQAEPNWAPSSLPADIEPSRPA